MGLPNGPRHASKCPLRWRPSLGRERAGEFHRIVNGKVVRNHEKRMRTGQDNYILVKDTHEAIIDRKLFEEVQMKVMRRWRSGKHSCRAEGFALSGFFTAGIVASRYMVTSAASRRSILLESSITVREFIVIRIVDNGASRKQRFCHSSRSYLLRKSRILSFGGIRQYHPRSTPRISKQGQEVVEAQV